MNYCQSKIVRDSFLRSSFPISLGALLIFIGLILPWAEARQNVIYEQQARLLGADNPIRAEFAYLSVYFIIGGAALLLVSLFFLVRLMTPQNTALGKSILRYERFPGDGDLVQMMADVDADLAHAPAFGSIRLGINWMAGPSGAFSHGAVVLSQIRGVFYFSLAFKGRGASGIPTVSRAYSLMVIDEKNRETAFRASGERPLMETYHALLRRNRELIHGGISEYAEFLQLSEEERERALWAARRNPNQIH